MKTVVDWVNHTLPYLKFKKKSVTRKTIYQWIKNYGDIYEEKVNWNKAFEFFKESIDRTIEQEPMQLSQHEISNYLKSLSPLPYPYWDKWACAYFEELQQITKNPTKRSVRLIPELFNIHIRFKISRHSINFDRICEILKEDSMIIARWTEAQPQVIRVGLSDKHAINKKFKYEPGCMSIWNSGKCTFTGGGNITLAKETVKTITTKLNKNDPDIIKNPRIKINNISAKIVMPRKISTDALLFALDAQDFEPEKNSYWVDNITNISENCLKRKMKVPNVYLEFYKSGKVIIRGAKKEGDIYKAVEKLSKNFWLEPFFSH